MPPSRTCLALLAAVLGPLSGSCAATAVPASTAAPEPATVGGVTFDLRDAAVMDMLHAVAAASGKPLMVAPDAQSVARCARVTLITTEPASAEALAPLVTRALRSASLELEVSERGWLVRRGEGPAPTECAPVAEKPEPTATTHDTDTASLESAISGIREVAQNQFELRRSSLNAILENQTWLMRSARIVPYHHNGVMDGVRVFGIRAGSLLHVLGLRNGDKLLRMAGLPLHSPDKALEAYAKVRNASVVEMEIERDGTPVTIVYRVVDD
jgi:type II secretory pathway component GspD/PulD (secretin)